MDLLPAPSWCLLQVACGGCLRTVWWTSGVAAVGGSPSGGATTGFTACWWWYSHCGSSPSPSALGGLLELRKRVNGSGCLDLSGAAFTVQGMVCGLLGFSYGACWPCIHPSRTWRPRVAALGAQALAALSWATCTGLATCLLLFFSHQSRGCSCRWGPFGATAAASWRNSQEVGGLGSGRCRLLMGTKSKDADFVDLGQSAARWMGGLQLSGGKLGDWRWLASVRLHVCSVVRRF